MNNMDKLQLHAAIADHVEVLKQYSTNENTDKKTLALMIETLLCKFTKKEYLYLALEMFFNDHFEVEMNVKADWDVLLPSVLNNHTFKNDPYLGDQIVTNVKAFYKIK